MARRRAAPVAEEEDEEQEQEKENEDQGNGLVKLRFNEALSWRPGQTIPAEQLIKRLDRLSKELSDLDQEQINTDSLAKTAKELAAPRLLNHKDKGVRAFTASCLVEMLRLYAPNAPYTPSQLKVSRATLDSMSLAGTKLVAHLGNIPCRRQLHSPGAG